MQLANRNIESQVDHFLHRTLTASSEAVKKICSLVADSCQRHFDDLETVEVRLSPPRFSKNGQTDIGLFLKGPSLKVAILIENKVASPFTHRQPERYFAEKEALLANGIFDEVVTVIICPATYAQKSALVGKFDCVVTYEQILEILPASDVVLQAIKLSELGWVAEEISEVSENFQIYESLVEQEFPGLRMKTKTSNKPLQSRTIYFHEPDIGEFRRDWPTPILNHQWQEGRAKLLFRGWGEKRLLLTPNVQKGIVSTNFRIDPNRTKSFGIMVQTPIIRNTTDKHQIDEMIKGLMAVQGISDWYLKNLDLIKTWSALAGPIN